MLDPNCLHGFEDHTIVIPEVVLEELNNNKQNPHPEVRFNVREAGRIIDNYSNQGNILEGVATQTGGLIRIENNHTEVPLPEGWDKHKADNRILQVCIALAQTQKDSFTALVTKDRFLRIKAKALKIEAQDYRRSQVEPPHRLYSGWQQLELPPDIINDFYSRGYAELPPGNYSPREFIVSAALTDPLIGQAHCINGKWFLKPCRYLAFQHKPYGLTPKNLRQQFMLEALMDPEITCVTISGSAGTGKTLFALAVGLDRVENGAFRHVLACRPAVPMGENLGFLPGNEKEKISPYMRPFYDNLYYLITSEEERKNGYNKEKIDSCVDFLMGKMITVQAVAFLRGRSISGNWILIDEAQNLTPNQVRSIITRVGEGSKIVIAGDPSQIDNPYLDSQTNGLSYAVKYMRPYRNSAHISLTSDDVVRSDLASWATANLPAQ